MHDVRNGLKPQIVQIHLWAQISKLKIGTIIEVYKNYPQKFLTLTVAMKQVRLQFDYFELTYVTVKLGGVSFVCLDV